MYREVYILRHLRGSPHIITLQDIIAPHEPGGRPFKDLCVGTADASSLHSCPFRRSSSYYVSAQTPCSM